jgi:cytochrome c551/c552
MTRRALPATNAASAGTAWDDGLPVMKLLLSAGDDRVERDLLTSKGRMKMVRWTLLFVSVTLLIGQSALAAQPSAGEMDELASAKGCYLCHRAEPVKRKPEHLLPPAPSWRDIALMYQGHKDAEDRLTEIVLGGSGNKGKDRHWKGKVSEVGMFPNVKELDEDQARQLVHWILSFTSERTSKPGQAPP